MLAATPDKRLPDKYIRCGNSGSSKHSELYIAVVINLEIIPFPILVCAKRTGYDTNRKEQVMGNRDKRGREKKKPKRKEIKLVSRPARPAPEYKPVAPPTSQTDEGTGE